MMETILGFLFKGVAAIMGFINAVFLQALRMDMKSFVDRFPFMGTTYEVLRTLATGLVILISVFQLYKFFMGPLTEVKDSPVKIMVRAVLAVMMIQFGGYLVEMIVDLGRMSYELFGELIKTGGKYLDPKGFDWGNAILTSITTGGIDAVTGAAGVKFLAGLILIIAIAIDLVKLIIEICERYLMVGLLAYVSPLAFSTVASSGTSMIFQRWLGMFFGQCLIMTLGVWFYGMAISGIAAMENAEADYFFVQVLLILAACRLGQRADTYMQQLGIGVGTTGGSMLDEMVGVAQTLGHALNRQSGVGGEDGTGHRRDSVLGGISDNSGNVKPDAFGSGLLGAVVTGGRYAAQARRNGENVAQAFGQGAIKGSGLGSIVDGARSAAQAKKAGGGLKDVGKAAKDGLMKDPDISFMTGRKLNDKILSPLKRHRQSLDPVTVAQTGKMNRSANGENLFLDKKAQANGIKLDNKNGRLGGDAAASGDFMAANMGKNLPHDVLAQTAMSGDPLASEQALFGTHNDLSYEGTEAEVSREKFDQLGSGMLAATIGDPMQELGGKPKDQLTDAEKRLLSVNDAMEASMNGDRERRRLSDFSSHDFMGKPDAGRELTASIKDKNGMEVGSLQMLDQKAYSQLDDGKKAGYSRFESSSGAAYYMKANNVETSSIQADKAEKRLFGQGGLGDGSQEDIDRIGSEAMASMFGPTLHEMQGEPVQTAGSRTLAGLADVVQPSLDVPSDGRHLANFTATDTEGGGRMVGADIKTENGDTVGSMKAIDQIAYDHLSAEQRPAYTPVSTSSGASYYLKATGVNTTSLDTGSPSRPMILDEGNLMAGNGPCTTAMREDGCDLAVSTEGRFTASDPDVIGRAVNEGLSCHPTSSLLYDIAQATVQTMEPSVAEESLYDPECGDIPVGHDREVATMMGKVFDDPTMSKALTVAGTSPDFVAQGGGMALSDAAVFGEMVRRSAVGDPPDETGRYCDNFNVYQGIASCDYHTPSGSYRIQTMDADLYGQMQIKGEAPQGSVAPIVSCDLSTGTPMPCTMIVSEIDRPVQPTRPSEVIAPESPTMAMPPLGGEEGGASAVASAAASDTARTHEPSRRSRRRKKSR